MKSQLFIILTADEEKECGIWNHKEYEYSWGIM